MKRIIDYTVLSYTNYSACIAKVNTMRDDGWQPFGGPSYADGWMHQAMVRYEEKTPSNKAVSTWHKRPDVEEKTGELIGVVAIDGDDFMAHCQNKLDGLKRYMVGEYSSRDSLFDGIEWTEEVRRIEDLKTLARCQMKPNILPENRP